MSLLNCGCPYHAQAGFPRLYPPESSNYRQACSMPILGLLAPSRAQIDRYLVSKERADFNYPNPGSTQDAAATDIILPEGLLWQLDNTRVQLGHGRVTYNAAKELLQRWGQFQLPWTQVDAGTPVAEGSMVAVKAKTLFMWSVNPLKIVYVKESGERSTSRRLFGGRNKQQQQQQPVRWQFAHGCVQGHLLSGEESFRLEYHPADDSVWYEVLTFSRPVHPLAILSYPITRYFQWRFANESAAALAAALRQAPDMDTGKQATSKQWDELRVKNKGGEHLACMHANSCLSAWVQPLTTSNLVS